MNHIQLNHQQITNQIAKFNLVVIVENVSSAENIGMIFRNCDAFGVKHVYLTGNSVVPPHKKIKRTSRSAEAFIDYSYFNTSTEVIALLQKENYTTIGIEITSNSKDLRNYTVSPKANMALIVGSEQHGISQQTLDLVDDCIEIKMFGRNSSMNVVSAFSIALYEITKQLS